MDEVGNDLSLSELLKPQTFKRQKSMSTLYAPYSLKLHRRTHFYGPDAYDIWALIESDPLIRIYNESVRPIPLAVGVNKIRGKSPLFVTQNQLGDVDIHILNDDKTDEDSFIHSWRDFCSYRGFGIKIWPGENTISSTWLDNVKRLLRYTSSPSFQHEHHLETKLIAAAKGYRSILFYRLIQEVPSSDPELIKIAIAHLVLKKQLFSDLHLHPLTMQTELSAYHEFPQ